MKNRMSFHGLLPVGSVVRIADIEKRLMIIGRVLKPEGEDYIHDYCSVPFPEGYLDDEHLIFHEHSDISYICRVGYINDSEMELEERLEAFLQEKRGFGPQSGAF